MTVSVSLQKQKHVSDSLVLLHWLLAERTEVVTGWAAGGNASTEASCAASAVRKKCQRHGSVSSRQPERMRWLGVVDCVCCLGEDYVATLISKWPQANEGMREGWHNMSRHCCLRE